MFSCWHDGECCVGLTFLRLACAHATLRSGFKPHDVRAQKHEWCFYFDDGNFYKRNARGYLNHMVKMGACSSIQVPMFLNDSVRSELNSPPFTTLGFLAILQ